MRAALLALTLAACAEPTAARPAAVPDLPRAGVAAKASMAAGEDAWIGVVAPAEAVDVAPPFDGVLAAIRVRPGDAVEAGAVLATLDERPLREEVAAARAGGREATANARRATVEVERARHRLALEERGLADGTSPRATVEDARFAVRAAEAAAAMASAAAAHAAARLDRASSRLAETAVRAPFAGTIAARYRDAGAAVGPSAPVARLVGGGAPRLRFAVGSDQAARLARGTRVVADLPGGASIAAVVERVAPEIDQASQRVFVDAAIAGAPADLPPGLPATVRAEATP